MKDEGWIIESDGLLDDGPRYLALSGGMSWTDAAGQALRFARLTDAASFAAIFVPGPTHCRRFSEAAPEVIVPGFITLAETFARHRMGEKPGGGE